LAQVEEEDACKAVDCFEKCDSHNNSASGSHTNSAHSEPPPEGASGLETAGAARADGSRKRRDMLQEFEELSRTFSAFDDCVDAYSMFKYQHVSDHYIVACPSVADPFDGGGGGRAAAGSYKR